MDSPVTLEYPPAGGKVADAYRLGGTEGVGGWGWGALLWFACLSGWSIVHASSRGRSMDGGHKGMGVVWSPPFHAMFRATAIGAGMIGDE